MFVEFIKCLLCVLLTFEFQSMGQDIPSFRIISPQSVCKSDEADLTKSSPTRISVSFQPRDGIKLSYKFRIFFKTLEKENYTQRETLLIWKAVRTLQNKLNAADRLQISDSNMVFINQAEVVPGANYIFHVVGVSDAGATSKEKVFSMKYSNGVLQTGDIPLGTNLLLLGSEFAVAGSQYILHAKVSFCKPKFDYYIRWKMLNLDEELQEILLVSSQNLKIPPNKLQAGSRYKIEADVLQSNNVLAKDSIDVTVLKRGFEAYIIPTSTRIGINKPTSFQLFIRDYDNIIDNIQVFWEYTSMNYVSQPITGATLSKTKFEVIFREPGRFKVTATLKLNELEKTVMADVEIDANIISNFEFDEIANIEVAAKQEFKFTVLVLDLIPNCKSGWTSAQEDGFVYINQEELDTQLFGITEIKDLEKAYLAEIADFGNSTVNREIVLFIPPLKQTSNRWQGFQGDSSYKFRLDTVCPGPYFPQGNPNPSVISHFEFEIHTNSPPQCDKLEVKPTNGTALRTVFQLSTATARDTLLDTPLTYEFLAEFQNQSVSFNKFYDYKTLETRLPFTSMPIQLKVKICDIRNACSTIRAPNVSVAYTEITKLEFQNQIEEIKKAFSRTDFEDGNNLILMAAITYKNGNSQLLNKLRDLAEEIFEKEINRMIERPTEKFYLPHEKIIKFVALTKRNLEVLSINKLSYFNKLFEIMEQMTHEVENNENQSIYEGYKNNSDEFHERFRRQPKIPTFQKNTFNNFNSEYIRINLQLIERILSLDTKKISLDKLTTVERVNLLAEKWCRGISRIQEDFDSPIASIHVEKLTGSYLLRKQFEIKNIYTLESGSFKIDIPELYSRVNKYCVTLIQYPEDYETSEKTPSIFINVIDLQAHGISGTKELNQFKTEKKRNIIKLTINKHRNDQNTCFLQIGLNWTSDLCKVENELPKFITCKCSQFGHIRLGTAEIISDNAQVIQLPPPTDIKIRFPNENNIQTGMLDIASTTITPTTPFSMVSLTSIQISTGYQDEHAETTVRQNLEFITEHRIENEHRNKNLSTASVLVYTLPLLFVLLIMLLTFLILVYRRRRSNQKESVAVDHIWGMVFRQQVPGVKYAKLCNEYVISGNFERE